MISVDLRLQVKSENLGSSLFEPEAAGGRIVSICSNQHNSPHAMCNCLQLCSKRMLGPFSRFAPAE